MNILESIRMVQRSQGLSSSYQVELLKILDKVAVCDRTKEYNYPWSHVLGFFTISGLNPGAQRE